MKSLINLRKTTLAVALLVAGFSYNAMAFDTDEVQNDQAAYAEQFDNLDASGNGLLTWSEAAKDKSISNKVFTNADKDHDGTLDKDEYAQVKTEVGQKRVGQVVSDSVITTKAKAKLLAAEEFKSLKISVETHKGEVILSGFVNNAEDKDKAEQVVSQIEGVKSVKNSLVVKS